VTENLRIRSANPTDADELLAIRRDAIMALAEEYGRVAAERWATAAHPDRAAKAIATNSVWVTEFGSKVVGWVEVSGATIESLYVSPAAARLGVGSSLLTHAERQIREAQRTQSPPRGPRSNSRASTPRSRTSWSAAPAATIAVGRRHRARHGRHPLCGPRLSKGEEVAVPACV
jgi:GNAT superfamily N-acetyltransferase